MALPELSNFQNESQFNQAIAQHAFTTEDGVSYARSKIALLIGNQRYEKMDPLTSPHNDVMEMKKILTEMNFSVFAYFDLNFKETMKLLDTICKLLGPGMYLFFYYSGHGFHYDFQKIDHIIPVDASSSPLRSSECLSTDYIEKRFQSTLCKVFTFYDCCRVSREPEEFKEPMKQCSYSNICRFFSCSSQKPAYEKKSEACSVFNKALRSGLVKKLKISENLWSHIAEVMKNESVSKGGDVFQGPEVLPKMMPPTITLHEEIMRNIWDIEKEQINPFTYTAPKDIFLTIEGMAKAHITFSFNVINQLQISTKTVLNTGQCKDVETRIESLTCVAVTKKYATDGTIDFFISGIQKIKQDILRLQAILSVTSQKESRHETKKDFEIPLNDRWQLIDRQ